MTSPRGAQTTPSRAAPQGSITSQEKALLVARAALDKQADAVAVMDVRHLSSVTDFFVVCTAGSPRQIDAIKTHVEATLAQHRSPVFHTEGSASVGHDEPQWVLMDCGDIVVHLLDQHARAFYRLEELWADAPRVPVGTQAQR